jgi:ribosomal protein S18 acetylase RimI-like enzyme
MVTIRSATVTDIPEVLRVWQLATTESSATDDAVGIETLLRSDPDALLVAVRDGQIIGTVIATWDGWRGAMYRLAVLPAFRRMGVATSLVSHGERRLVSKGARRLHMIVVSDQQPAQAFWASAGYELSGQLRYVKTV